MVKIQNLIVMGVVLWSLPVFAEQSVVTDYLANVEEQASARMTARDLLQKQPRKMEINLQAAAQKHLQTTADADETAAIG